MSSRYYLFLRAKHFPQDPGLKHPKSVFLSSKEKVILTPVYSNRRLNRHMNVLAYLLGADDNILLVTVRTWYPYIAEDEAKLE